MRSNTPNTSIAGLNTPCVVEACENHLQLLSNGKSVGYSPWEKILGISMADCRKAIPLGYELK